MFGNWVKTSILFAGIIALFGAVGAAIGGAEGMLIALLVGAGLNLFAYWNSDRAVLAMYHAREVDSLSGGHFHAMVRDLAARAELPMPRV
jgi:heat shock protein HtpX